ncbi:MAG TPA: efflux RND transporter periplasmic adaptor subunit, partial [Xanthomonadales bacterium]|nr:efflux RND transporter periplasmic adaptor subunit [Xanthomonadales bacterium]
MRTRLVIAMLAALGVAGFFGLSVDTKAQQPAAAPAPPPAPVEVVTATNADFAPVQRVPGSVVSRADARVAAEQAGRVTIVADVGSTVAAGDVLARVDDEALQLAIDDNEAALARIDAQLAFAERQLERMSSLEQRSSLAATQLDQSRSERDMLVQDRARARVTLAESRRRLRAATIRAPFAGVVAERYTQVGEFLAAGAPVVRLVDTQAVEVRAQAPVALAAQLKAGDAVTLEESGRVELETIRAVVPVGDAQSRQLEVRVAMSNAAWPIGTAVDVALPSRGRHESVAVPRDALILRQDGTYVFRITADGTAERIAIETGATRGDLVEVRGAVAAGDRLVVRGGER